jgi:sarcosine oxidase subunit beta
MSQSDKGGLVYGGDIDGYNSYAQRNLPIVQDVQSEMLALFPPPVRMLRSWGGVCDMSMDGSPIIASGPLPGMYLNCGWCYGGFKATPASASVSPTRSPKTSRTTSTHPSRWTASIVAR